jgi:DNA-binding transcriptional regulator GbsR (MarR family)
MSPLIDGFIAHFGEMGSRWGINRTVGQIYALLFVSAEPMHADQIAERLGVSRSNVSISLKELEGWQLVRQTRRPGDRHEYYATLGSVWEIFRTIAAERRRREVEPTLSLLREAMLRQPLSVEEAHAQARLREMYELTEQANAWFDELQRLSPESLLQLMQLGAKVQRLLEFKDRTRALLGADAASVSTAA